MIMDAQEQTGKDIVDCAIAVHTSLGPGLLESAYEACLAYELEQRGHFVERQKTQPITYKNLEIENGYRLDLLVNNSVVVELKAAESLLPIHKAQIITYLKLSQISLGFLINFNSTLLKDGLHRIVNNHTQKYNHLK
jgi:GxxExxY protein